MFSFLSFRAGMALLVSLVISLLFGGRLIRILRGFQMKEQVRDLGLEGQKEKEGTPTMGGVIIVLATVVPCLLFGDLTNVYIILLLASLVWMASIGFLDDYIKVFKKDKRGLHGRLKVLGQIVLGIIISVTMLTNDKVCVRLSKDFAEQANYHIVKELPADRDGKIWVHANSNLTNVPFIKGNVLDYSTIVTKDANAKGLWTWLLFLPLVVFIVTAVSNGANLTDGLDGLAAGVSSVSIFTMAVFAYVSGNLIFSDYLNILFIPHSGEIVVFALALMGGCIGFLWYNAYPAKVFMGDTGSLAIGGVIASTAILLRKEWLIPIMCGVFLAENLSVIVQVAYFKYTKKRTGEGRRILLMAPLHHHFQKLGIHEAKIVARFWIISIFLAVVAIITLKIR